MEHWFRPMGLALRVTTNSPKLAAAVREAYGVFGTSDARGEADLRFDFTESSRRCPSSDRKLDPLPGRHAHPATGQEDDRTNCPFDSSTGSLEYRMAADRAELLVGGRAVLSIEPARGEARGCFPEEFVDGQSAFRLHALHFALSAALPARGFLGVHAACIVIDGRAVLLRGPRAAGKSVLAYAAALRGYRVVAGSTVWVAPGGIAWWGIPRWIYLRNSARALFPEIPAGPEVPIGGERKIEIAVAQGPAGGVAPGIVVLLERNLHETARLETISKPEALSLWDSGSAGNETGQPGYAARIAQLLDGPAYRLNCAGDLDRALDRIAAAAQDYARC